MANENKDRNDGQNIHGAYYICERVESVAKTKWPRKQRTPVQMAKLQKATTFVTALKPLLFITYRFTCEKVSYYKCALRHVLHWISGEPPDCKIDYSKVLIASGNRFNTERAVAKPAGETILFQWENDLLPKEYALDKTILVAYCEALNKCIFTTMGSPRINRRATLQVAAFRGQTVHTWLSFITADGKQVADSIYTGKLVVAR